MPTAPNTSNTGVPSERPPRTDRPQMLRYYSKLPEPGHETVKQQFFNQWDTPGHYHRNSSGRLVRCYHICKNNLTSWKFWFGMTVMNWIEFIPEHLFWFKVPFFDQLPRYLHIS